MPLPLKPDFEEVLLSQLCPLELIDLSSCPYQENQKMWMSQTCYDVDVFSVDLSTVVVRKRKSRNTLSIWPGRPGRNMIGNVPSQLTRQMCEIGGVNVEVEAKSLGFEMLMSLICLGMDIFK